MRRTSRRAFTLLETVAAASLGGLMVLAVLAILVAMDRTEFGSQRQLAQQSAMQRAQIVLERTFSSLVVAPQDVVAAMRAAAAGQEIPREGEGEAGLVRTGGGARAEAQTPPRPRVLLEADPNAERWVAQTPWRSPAPPQRLEVVVSRPPVPPGFMDAFDGGQVSALAATLEPAVPTGAIRGVFELRPDAATPMTSDLGDPPDGWTLWWRPLPRTDAEVDGSRFQLDPTLDPRAVPIASGLATVQWVAFREGQRSSSLSVTDWINDLPGYIEMQVMTTTGIYANWMFELGWTTGRESGDAEETSAEGTGGEGSAGGDARSSTGGGRGTGRGGSGGGGGDAGGGGGRR